MPSDLCQICNKQPSTIGGHWVHAGIVYSEYSCAKCYGERRGNMSVREWERLEGNAQPTPKRKTLTPVTPLPEKPIKLWQPSFPRPS